MVVTRVGEWLRDEGLQGTRQGKVFMAWQDAMHDRYEEAFLPLPVDNADVSEQTETDSVASNEDSHLDSEVDENAQEDGRTALDASDEVEVAFDPITHFSEAEDDSLVIEPPFTLGLEVFVAASVVIIHSHRTPSPSTSPQPQPIPVAPSTPHNLQAVADHNYDQSAASSPTYRGRSNGSRQNTRQSRRQAANRSRSPTLSLTSDDLDSKTDPSSLPSRSYHQRSPARRRSHHHSAAARDRRELQHRRQSHFVQTRQLPAQHYQIVLELSGAASITALGGLEFRVHDRDLPDCRGAGCAGLFGRWRHHGSL
jgi:hypothetical protein